MRSRVQEKRSRFSCQETGGDGRLAASLAALAAKLAAAGHGCSALGTLDWNQRSTALLAESRTAGVRCLAVCTGDGTDIPGRNSAVVASGRCTVAAASSVASSVTPSVAVATLTSMMIVPTVVTPMPAFTMMTTQQYVQETHIHSPL